MIPRRNESGPCPLSFAQQRLWFLNQLEPHSLAYNQPKAIHLKGILNIETLKRVLEAIVARHEVLRTTFPSMNGQPVQVVGENPSAELPMIDLSEIPADKREANLEHVIAQIAERPFDLSQDLMLRASLIRLSPAEHVLLLVTHHIVSDGWSSGILFRELAALYEAFSDNRPSPFPDLPIQYADFAVWQRQWLQGNVLESQLAYWKRQLGGNLSVLHLPTDHSRPSVQTDRGGWQTVALPMELAEALGKLSRRNRITLFMTLLAAFQTLLYRYTGQEDIPIGVPIANRTRVEIEGLIGFFANTLVLRTDLSANPTFQELLRRIREVALGAYAHQDLPFEKLVEEINPDRDLGRNPLFQVTFNLQNPTNQEIHLSDLSLSALAAHSGTAKFDLSLSIVGRKQDLMATMAYNADLFERATISRMVGHFQTLLRGIVTNPERRLSDIPILTEAEKRQVLVQWNHTKRDYPNDKCAQQLFEAQVERSPDATALIFEDKQLTYRELNRRANQLAHYLKKLGVGPEVVVGIYMERSFEMMAGLLGILKAGGAYVPLDPAYPKDRLAFMLEDAQVPVLLTQHRLVEELPAHAVQVVCLDTDWQVIARESEEMPTSTTTPENLVYVIYTSGSTGRPKGVAVEHRQLSNYLHAILEKMAIPNRANFATVSTFAADLGHTVIFSSFYTGGCLHVISEAQASDPVAMADYFQRYSIDCLKIVPSHLAALQNPSHPKHVLPHQLLILGGEASRTDWVQDLQALAPGCTILNHYGPTETTVGVITYKVVKDQCAAGASTLPLGRPIANTQIYLLDRYLQPVPIGVTGELYIGGGNLARGYLKRPEMTAEKFIPNPFGDEQGARLYKTGDLARWLPDGNIEFIGRTDGQIKLRGFRIELGEIEATLAQHPDLREVAVLDLENSRGQKRLVAYVVANKDRAPTITGRRRYKLPNHMAVAQLNKHETDYIYEEVFERQAYLRHGITIREGDCVFDVGANIGLFLLFIHQMCKTAKVYAFEPNPFAFEILGVNASLYAPGAKLFNCGLSNETKTASFTFFPGFSLFSGFYADAQVEKEVVRTFMLNQQKAGKADIAELLEHANGILDERFSSTTFPTHLRTLSAVMEEKGIECIDLLKINVEKSELDVLNGIKDVDWKKIKQIVLEVDVKENLHAILSLLEQQGYDFVVEQDVLLENTQLHYVYAIRPSEDRRLERDAERTDGKRLPMLSDSLLSPDELRRFLREKVPEYMVPSAFVFLDSLPLTPNGKVDRRALPAPDESRPELKEALVAPRTPAEKVIAEIWAQVLKLKQVGVDDNFFDLGGHSLLATQVISRVRDTFHVEFPLRALFENPTVASLAAQVAQTQGQKAVPEELADVLADLESLSDEEAQRLLAQENPKEI